MSDDDLPDARQVIAIHDEIEEEYDLKYTGAAVAAPRLKIKRLLDDVAEYDGTYMRAAALLRNLITSHFFEDANKRTAWAVTNIYLQNRDAKPSVIDDRVPHILKRVRRYDVDEIADWLATGDIDENRLEP
jgi:death-on-curing protein